MATKEKDESVVLSPEQKIVEISGDLKKYEKDQVKLVSITSDEGYDKANNFVLEVKSRINRIKQIKEEYIAPLKANIKKLEELFTTPQKGYEAIEEAVKGGMITFRREQERIAREEESRLRKIREEQAEKDRLARIEAEKKGKPVPPPVMSVAPVAVVERKEATVKSEGGRSTAKKFVNFRVINADLLPKKYKDLIFAKAVEKGIVEQILRPIIKVEGMTCVIPGIEVFEDFDISLTAN